MSTIDEHERIKKRIREYLKVCRKYAPSFDWFKREKDIKEIGITRIFMQELERTGENFFQNLSILTHDPPDVIAETFVGKLIGVEVTELVDEKAVRQHQKGNEYFKFWSGKEIVEKIQNIINSKDIKVFYGGPYEKIILLIIQMSRFCLMKNSKNIFQLIVLIRQIK